MSREGLYKHYLYDNSYGKSGNHDFWDFGLKGQIVYKLNGRNFLVYNGAYFSQAPFLEDLFINPRLNAEVAPNIKSTIYNANDLSFVHSSPKVKMKLTAFYIDTQNDTSVQRFFADGLTIDAEDSAKPVESAFITQVMSNVEKKNMGVEFGIDYKVLPTLSLQGLASLGQYTYANNPTIYFASDVIGQFSNGKSYTEFGTANLKNYRTGGTAQQAFSLGFRYSSPKYWWFGANWNYLDNNYLDPSAIMRSENFVQNSTSGTPYADIDADRLREMMGQHKLPAAYFVNANVGKSWMLGKYYVLISATVNNILDNTRYITGGFEQTRNIKYTSFNEDYSRQDMLFGPKYWFTQGRSYFVNLQVRF